MGYVFSLATVLRFRLLREEREECILQQILQRMAQTTQTVEALDTRIEELRRSRGKRLAQRQTGQGIRDAYVELEVLQRRRDDLDAHMEKLEQLKERQLEVYQRARQDREMLTEMRNRERNRYAVELVRREQVILDDGFVARHRLRT